MFFKDAQLRKLYPVPELRTMGDLDCLIRQKERAKAHQLMEQLGYCCEIDSEPVWVYHRDGVVIEMHTQVAGGELGNGFDYQAYFSNAINHVVGQDGRLYLEREYHFCYLICHIAKHLCSTGAGVRMIADIAAFLHQYRDQMNWKCVECMLQESHLWKTATAVYGLCQRWFGLEPPVPWAGSEQILDDLEAYIVTGGIIEFETHDMGDVYRRNALRGGVASSGGRYRLRLLREYFFPQGLCCKVFSVVGKTCLVAACGLGSPLVGGGVSSKGALPGDHSIYVPRRWPAQLSGSSHAPGN